MCPISQQTGHLVAILYVDNNDLIHTDIMDWEQTAEGAHEDLQESVNSWENLLIASGGSLKLKPEKCFFYLMSFVWDSNGKWAYESNECKDEYRLGVPLPDSSMAEIYHLSVHTAMETLGVFTCPSGDPVTQFLIMLQKGQKWIDRALESHL